MGRISKRSSATDTVDPLTSEREQIDRLLARLRREANHVALGFSIQTAQATLTKRYAAFTPTGDVDADRATLSEFEQQATSLLRKAKKQQRDNGTRRAAGAAGIFIGLR